jgi:hypothetical protein
MKQEMDDVLREKIILSVLVCLGFGSERQGHFQPQYLPRPQSHPI